MNVPKFAPGDIVFAKIKGFAPWPAKVEFFETVPSTKQVRYNVFFYGTNQIGQQCKEEDLFPYVECRGKLGKPKKIPGFMDAVSLADLEVGLQPNTYKPGTSKGHTKASDLSHLDLLKAELQVLKIDQGIKNSLIIDKPRLDTCLKLLDQYDELSLFPLMFKKNPQLIDTLIKLQVYQRSTNFEQSTEKAKASERKMCRIRKKARNIYLRIQSIFIIPRGKTFMEAFAEELIEFQKMVQAMSEDNLLQLSKDPTVIE